MAKSNCGDAAGRRNQQADRASEGKHRPIAMFGDSQCLAMQGVVCVLCQEHCMARAIRFRTFLGGFARPEVRPELCDGCGLCASACPVGAIKLGLV